MALFVSLQLVPAWIALLDLWLASGSASTSHCSWVIAYSEVVEWIPATWRWFILLLKKKKRRKTREQINNREGHGWLEYFWVYRWCSRAKCSRVMMAVQRRWSFSLAGRERSRLLQMCCCCSTVWPPLLSFSSHTDILAWLIWATQTLPRWKSSG